MEDLTRLQIDGDKLKSARENYLDEGDHGLSLSEAARRVGVSRQYLWNIENNVQRPGSDVLARLCALYKIDIALLTIEGAPVAA